ncbi:MAG: hypothetical protein JWM93_1860 [Frankiales bacterium]|nr:hypothetical protein [Frankiales bacterium]
MPESREPVSAAAVDAALRKAAVVWLAIDGRAPVAVWPLWHGGRLHVVSGGAEQAAPGLSAADHVDVIVASKGSREAILRFGARATLVQPGSAEWEAVVPLLVPKRLNLTDPATAPVRWAAESVLMTLDPETSG